MTDFDPTDVRVQEKLRKDADQRAKLALQNEAEDLKWLLSSKRGRRIVWGLLERTGVYRSSFTGNSETFFREGQRNVGLMLVALIHEHCPEKYTLMIQEQREHGRKHGNNGRPN